VTRYTQLMIILCALLIARPDPYVAGAQNVSPLVIGDTFTIDSKTLGETRRLNVYMGKSKPSEIVVQ
jgi:hypothetical protein